MYPPAPADLDARAADLELRAAQDPTATAIIDPAAGETLTWRRLHEESLRVAGSLSGLGLEEGVRVAYLGTPGWRFVALLHACMRLGAALVPLPPRAPALTLATMLSDCAPALALAGPGRRADLDAAIALTGGAPRPIAGVDLEALPPGEVVAVEPRLTRDIALLYTSGTTGEPRGVRQTLGNHVASALGCQDSLGSQPGEPWLLTLSTHHVGGLAILLRSVVSAQPVVLLPRFHEAGVIDAMRAHRPALVSLVPTMLRRLLAAGGLDPLRGTRAILVGGAPAPASEVGEWHTAGLPVCPTYGLTETTSQVTTVPPGAAADLAGAAGLPHRYARISVEAAGVDLVPGEEGEIVVTGAVVTPGYVQQEMGVAALSGQGLERRIRTGDLGRLDTSGVLWVTGRVDDVINTGGESVNPQEVEAVLRAHPAVRDAAVRGIPDAVYGMVLQAMVVAESAGGGDLRAWCGERLSPFKVPREVVFVSSVPRNEGGKLLRREL